MKTAYLLYCLLCLEASSHPSKRQSSEEDDLKEWYMPALDWPDVNLGDDFALEGHSAGEPARRDAAVRSGLDEDDIASLYELETSSKSESRKSVHQVLSSMPWYVFGNIPLCSAYEDGTDISVQGGITISSQLSLSGGL